MPVLLCCLQVTAVDTSAPTAMCVLALGNSLAAQWGARLAAQRVLPTLAPLLVTPSFNQQQFATALKTVREVLGHIEKARSGAADGSPRTGAASPAGVAAVGPSGSAAGAGRAAASAAQPAPTDWMAATAVAPLSGSGGRAAAPAAAAGSAGIGGAANGDLLAGLQLQPQAPARPAAAPPAPSSGGSFGLAGGQVGSGKPMRASPLSTPTAQPNWAFGGATGTGGGSTSPSMLPGGILADPFAGLQLGGPASTAPKPAAAAASAVFDPFALGSTAQPRPPVQPQQQPMRPPAGGFGGSDGLSLI